jgi:hypothetical protein
MQRRSRGVLLALVAVFAMSAVTAAAASATTPEFKPVPAKKKFTSTSGYVQYTFNNGTEVLECNNSTAAGEVTGAKTLGKLVIKFTNCTTSGTGGSGCSVTSTGAKSGEIVTKSLEGELGTVKTTEAASGVGLLLKPESGKTWSVLAGNSCLSETQMSGSIAAEVPTIGKKQVTNKLVFSDPSGKQGIRSITLDSGKAEKPELVFWGTAMTMNTTDELSFEEALEVT